MIVDDTTGEPRQQVAALFVDAKQGQPWRAGNVEPLRAPANPEAGLVEMLHRRLADDQLPHMVDETLQPLGHPAAHRRQRRGAHGRVEQVGHQLRQTILGQEMRMAQIGRHRRHARTILHRRRHACGKRRPCCRARNDRKRNGERGVPWPQGGAAPAGRRPVLRHGFHPRPQPTAARRSPHSATDDDPRHGPACRSGARSNPRARAARRSACPICRAGSLSGAPPAASAARHSKEACCCSGCSGQAAAPALQDVAAGSRSRLANQRAARLAPRVARPFVRVASAKPQSVSFRHHHAAAPLAPGGSALKEPARTVGAESESP